MSSGWVRVSIPRVIRDAAVWRIRVGEVEGRPDDALAAPPGPCSVVVEADVKRPHIRVAARLDLKTNVERGRLTDVRIPIPEPWIERNDLVSDDTGDQRTSAKVVSTIAPFARTSLGHAATPSNEVAALAPKKP